VAKALQSLLEEVGMVVIGPAANISDAESLLSEQVLQVALVDVNLKGDSAVGIYQSLARKRRTCRRYLWASFPH
jgi:DNA-binding NarL/FixJ family response regulator